MAMEDNYTAPIEIELKTTNSFFANSYSDMQEFHKTFDKALSQQIETIQLILTNLNENEIDNETLPGLMLTHFDAALELMQKFIANLQLENALYTEHLNTLFTTKEQFPSQEFNCDLIFNIKEYLSSISAIMHEEKKLSPLHINFFNCHQDFWQRMLEIKQTEVPQPLYYTLS